LLFYSLAANRLAFYVSTNGIASANIDDTTVLANGVWYFVLGWHDPVANLLWVQVNNNAPSSVAHAGGVNIGLSNFAVGARSNVGGNHFDGVIDEAFFTKRIYTGFERSALYNSGNGIGYSDIGVTTRVGGIGEFIKSTDIGANATQVAQEYDADRRAGGIIKSIADLGDINGNVWIAGVGLDREFYFRSAAPPTEAA
jgi:hypothetical protein